MRYLRFLDKRNIKYGVLEENNTIKEIAGNIFII